MQMQKARVRNFHLLIKMELLDTHKMHQIKDLFHLAPLTLPFLQGYLIRNLLERLGIMVLQGFTEGGKLRKMSPRWRHHGNSCVHSSHQQLDFPWIYYLGANNQSVSFDFGFLEYEGSDDLGLYTSFFAFRNGFHFFCVAPNFLYFIWHKVVV